MSDALRVAREKAAVHDYKRAVRALESVEVLARYDIDEARGLYDLATEISCEGDSRRVRRECKFLADKADQIIRSYESTHVH
jgi:hypothetical protein